MTLEASFKIVICLLHRPLGHHFWVGSWPYPQTLD